MSEPKMLTVVLTDFNDLSSHDGIPFNKERVYEYIHSPEYTNLLENRHLLGLLTHGGRTELVNEIPEVDHILKHKDFCNVITKTWIENDKWLAEVQLVETEAAERLQKSLEAGIKCGVSIVVDIDNSLNDGYLIRKLYGVDFTLDPAFGSAQIVSRNFSGGKRVKSINVYCKQFSFKAYEKEMRRDPADLINYRMREVISILKTEKTSDNRIRWAKDYILEPLYKWLRYAFKIPGIVNISLGLRLNRWVPSPVLTYFNSAFNRLKRKYEQEGSVSVAEQKHFQPVYFQLINSMLSYIEKSVGSDIFKTFSGDFVEPSSYLNRMISSLYEYLHDEKITEEGLQERLDRVIKRRKEEGLDYLTLFDDPNLEEYVWHFLHAEEQDERKSWFNKVQAYLDNIVRVQNIV